MRLVSCVGLLMVIPAVGLLTLKNNLPDHKLQAVNIPNSRKTANSAPFKMVESADSVAHAKMDVSPVTPNEAKTNPLPAKQ